MGGKSVYWEPLVLVISDKSREILVCARWIVSTNSVKNREPFGYRDFKTVASHFVTYNNIILREGPHWLGCRFRSPVIWYPPKGYCFDYELSDGHEGIAFVNLIQKQRFRLYKEEVFPTYSLTALHINYLFHEDMKQGKQGSMLGHETGINLPLITLSFSSFLCICAMM